MEAIFQLPTDSPLTKTLTDDHALIPLRIPSGWTVVHNTLTARRLPDGSCEVNDSEDLFWARTAPPPWSKETPPPDNDVRRRELHLDAGWYAGTEFHLYLLAPDWDHIHSHHTTPDPDDLVTTLESWMTLISAYGRLPGK